MAVQAEPRLAPSSGQRRAARGVRHHTRRCRARMSPAPSAAEVARAVEQTLRTEFAFELPRGYVDDPGTVHRDGPMRLATAGDEFLPLRDPRFRDNESYLTVLLLSRVVTRLGTVS